MQNKSVQSWMTLHDAFVLEKMVVWLELQRPSGFRWKENI
jgi:hypothetical protein